MAESTLSTTLDDIRKAIGLQIGVGIDSTKWSADDLAQINMFIKSGLRQFYWPPKLYDDEPPHKWSFLEPITTITTVAPYSTGTIAIALAGTTVTLTTGVWPSWTATHGTLIVDSTEYAIASRTDDTHIELSTAWTEATETAAEFSLEHDGNYDLPDDFGGILGSLTFASGEYQSDILIVGEGKIRSLRSGDDSSSVPVYAAVRPKEQTTLTSGQRFEMMFWPKTNDAYVLSYRKQILPQMLVDTTITYPYGGAMHSETIEASCLAMAELKMDGVEGIMAKHFMKCLSSSIQTDKKIAGVEYFGYNGDNSGNSVEENRANRPFKIFYRGEQY